VKARGLRPPEPEVSLDLELAVALAVAMTGPGTPLPVRRATAMDGRVVFELHDGRRAQAVVTMMGEADG
jgi:hypothetical protein